MNEAHWHLLVNHLPIIFPVVGVIVLITGLISKSEAVKRSSFLIFIIGALATIAAMYTGGGAEDVVAKISGISESYIETHEEAAETFAILSYLLGTISILGLWTSFKRKTYSSLISISTLVFAFVVLFFAKQVGTTGGEIRHTEIRADYKVDPAANTEYEKGEKDN